MKRGGGGEQLSWTDENLCRCGQSKSVVFSHGQNTRWKQHRARRVSLADSLEDRVYLDGEGMVAGTSMVQEVCGIDSSAGHRSGSRGQLIRMPSATHHLQPGPS